MFADDDLAASVRKHGRYYFGCAVKFEHPHPLTNGQNKAGRSVQTREFHESYEWATRLEQRRAAGFPRVELPGWEVMPSEAADAKARSVASGGGKLKRILSAVGEALNPPPVLNPRRNIAVVCRPNRSTGNE